MNEGLQVTKMVLSLQRAFTAKWYYETHSLKCVCDDFIQELRNSMTSSNHTIQNSIKKN